MRVEWLEKALKNLEDEASYISIENPKAADDFSSAIFASVDKLSQFPSMGREGGSGTLVSGSCQTGLTSSRIGCAVTVFKSSACSTHGSALVRNGEVRFARAL